MLTSDKELRRVSGSQVLGCVELLSSAFADASDLIATLRKGQKKRKDERDFHATLLSKVLEEGGHQIRDAYDQGYGQLGTLFRIGDDEARGQLLGIAVDIDAYVIKPLKTFLADDKAATNLLKVQEVAITGRHDAVRCLNTLCLRLRKIHPTLTHSEFSPDSSVCGDDTDTIANHLRLSNSQSARSPRTSGLRRILSSGSKGESKHRRSRSDGSTSQEPDSDASEDPFRATSPPPPLSVEDVEAGLRLNSRPYSCIAPPPAPLVQVEKDISPADSTTSAQQTMSYGSLTALPLTMVWHPYSIGSRQHSIGQELRLQTSSSPTSPPRTRMAHPFQRQPVSYEPLESPRPAPPTPVANRARHDTDPPIKTNAADTSVPVVPLNSPMVPSPLRQAITPRAASLTQSPIPVGRGSIDKQEYDQISLYSQDGDAAECKQAEEHPFVDYSDRDREPSRSPVSPLSSGASSPGSPCRSLQRRSVSPVSPTTDYSPSFSGGGRGRESDAYSYMHTPKDTAAPSMHSTQGANTSMSGLGVQETISVQDSGDIIDPQSATYEAWKTELQAKLKDDRGRDAKKQLKEEAKLRLKALKAEERVKLLILKEEEKQMLIIEKEQARIEKEKAKELQKVEKQRQKEIKEEAKRLDKAKRIMVTPAGAVGHISARSGPPPLSAASVQRAAPPAKEPTGTPSSSEAKALRSPLKRPDTAMSVISALSKDSGKTATTADSSTAPTKTRTGLFGGKGKSKEESEADKAANAEARKARAKYMAERYGTAYMMAAGAGGGGC